MPINHAVRVACAALAFLIAAPLWAQSSPPPQGRPGPPPNAYADCRGRKAGDRVQHTTPRGTGPAVCLDSPEGLVARPEPPPGPAPAPPGAPPPPPDRK